MLHSHLRLMFALAFAAIVANQAMAQSTSAASIVATVNGAPIPKALFDFIVKERTQHGAPDNEQTRKSVENELVNRELAIQEAARKGLTENADLIAQIELSRQTLIVRAYAQDLLKSQPITDEALKAEYEKIKGQFVGKEYKARHILVEKEAEAGNIVAKLKKGEKFEDLAKVSKDIGTRDRGGDLGWNVPANYVKPFAESVLKLEKGKYTETPVQTRFGWHVIRLDDSRQMKTPSFDELKPRLLQHMQQQAVTKAVAELRAKAKIE